jgi:hypothetical protein
MSIYFRRTVVDGHERQRRLAIAFDALLAMPPSEQDDAAWEYAQWKYAQGIWELIQEAKKRLGL